MNRTGGTGGKAVPAAAGGVGAVLVLGATSGIGRHIAHELAKRGYRLVLAGRTRQEVEGVSADIGIRYGTAVQTEVFDALAVDLHESLVRRVSEAEGGMEGVVLTFGLLGDQAIAVRDFAHAREIIDVNYTGAVSVLTHAANLLEARGRGFILAVTSVAGDRGRQSNYVYGSAKGALSLFLQGLRNRLHPRGVRVLTVKPGVVDTRMTYGRSGSRLMARQEHVAKRIVRALERGRDVAYVPGFWRPIMFVIRTIPERLFKRLRL